MDSLRLYFARSVPLILLLAFTLSAQRSENTLSTLVSKFGADELARFECRILQNQSIKLERCEKKRATEIAKMLPSKGLLVSDADCFFRKETPRSFVTTCLDGLAFQIARKVETPFGEDSAAESTQDSIVEAFEAIQDGTTFQAKLIIGSVKFDRVGVSGQYPVSASAKIMVLGQTIAFPQHGKFSQDIVEFKSSFQHDSCLGRSRDVTDCVGNMTVLNHITSAPIVKDFVFLPGLSTDHLHAEQSCAARNMRLPSYYEMQKKENRIALSARRIQSDLNLYAYWTSSSEDGKYPYCTSIGYSSDDYQSDFWEGVVPRQLPHSKCFNGGNISARVLCVR